MKASEVEIWFALAGILLDYKKIVKGRGDYFMSKSETANIKRGKPREKRNRQSTTAPEEKDEEEEEPQRFVTYGAANSYGGAVTSYDDDEWGVGSGHVSKKID